MRKLRNFRIDLLNITLAMLTFLKFKSEVFIFLLNSRQTRLASYSTSVLKDSMHKTKTVTTLSKHPHDNFPTSPWKSQDLSYQRMATTVRSSYSNQQRQNPSEHSFHSSSASQLYALSTVFLNRIRIIYSHHLWHCCKHSVCQLKVSLDFDYDFRPFTVYSYTSIEQTFRT